MIRRHALGMAFTLLAVALLMGCSATGEKVTFAFDNRITSVELLIGIERGYFAEQGLDVQTAVFNGTTETLPSLARGAVDVAPTGAFGAAYINVIQRGAQIRLVAARSVHGTDACDYTSFVARRGLVESGRLSDFASVRGLRLLVDRTSSQYFYVSSLLRLGGLQASDVTLVSLPLPMTGDALARGLVDVGIGTEPSTFRMVSAGAASVWRPFSDVAPGQQSTFLMFGSRLLGERRDIGRKIMAGWLKAVADYRQEAKSDRNVALVARLTHMPEAEVRELCWPAWSPEGRIDPAGLERVQRWALEEGLIERVSPYSELVDDSFLPIS